MSSHEKPEGTASKFDDQASYHPIQ